MKTYNTTAGVLLEYDNKFTLLSGHDWDVLLNADDLYAHLRALHQQLPVCEHARAVLAASPLPPMESQELWAAGVTYLRSKQERQEEAKEAGGAVHAARRRQTYDHDRPHRTSCQ